MAKTGRWSLRNIKFEFAICRPLSDFFSLSHVWVRLFLEEQKIDTRKDETHCSESHLKNHENIYIWWHFCQLKFRDYFIHYSFIVSCRRSFLPFILKSFKGWEQPRSGWWIKIKVLNIWTRNNSQMYFWDTNL